MKKSLIIAVLLLSSLSVFGQRDTMKVHPFRERTPGIFRLYTGLTAPKPERFDKFDRFNTDFFWNSWIGEQNGVKTKFYAIGHAINLMFDVPFEKKGRIGMGIGLGYSHFNVRSDGEFNFVPSGTDFYSELAPFTGADRWINRTVFNFVEVPFELRFRAARERGKFKFYPGFRAGFMVEYFHKHRIEGDEFKEFNFPDIQRFHYGPTLRIGVDNFMLFGYYDLAPLFENSNSSNLQLFAAGISIGWF